MVSNSGVASPIPRMIGFRFGAEDATVEEEGGGRSNATRFFSTGVDAPLPLPPAAREGETGLESAGLRTGGAAAARTLTFAVAREGGGDADLSFGGGDIADDDDEAGTAVRVGVVVVVVVVAGTGTVVLVVSELEGLFCFNDDDLVRKPGANPANPVPVPVAGAEVETVAAECVVLTAGEGGAVADAAADDGTGAASSSSSCSFSFCDCKCSSASSSSKMALMSSRGRSGIGFACAASASFPFSSLPPPRAVSSSVAVVESWRAGPPSSARAGAGGADPETGGGADFGLRVPVYNTRQFFPGRVQSVKKL